MLLGWVRLDPLASGLPENFTSPGSDSHLSPTGETPELKVNTRERFRQISSACRANDCQSKTALGVASLKRLLYVKRNDERSESAARG